MFKMLGYVIVKIFQGQAKKVHWVVWISALLFLARMVQLVKQGG